MDLHDLSMTVFRASLVYFFVLFIVRLLGKREVGNLSAFDLIVALMIGEVVDEVIYGDVTILKGFLAIGTVAVWHMINSWASLKSKFIDRLTEAEPTLLVENGEIISDALASERMSEDELWSQLRLQGIADAEDLKDVKKATLETDGEVSVILQDWAKPLTKQDLENLKRRAA